MGITSFPPAVTDSLKLFIGSFDQTIRRSKVRFFHNRSGKGAITIKVGRLSNFGLLKKYSIYFDLLKSYLMNIKLNPIEVARFLICLGIAWIAWMTHYHTGAIF